MANVKSILIVAQVPFNFMAQLPDADAACLGSLLLTPSIGLRHAYTDERLVPNAQVPRHYLDPFASPKGKCAVYTLTIRGQEALSFGHLDTLKRILESVGTITTWEVRDLEA